MIRNSSSVKSLMSFINLIGDENLRFEANRLTLGLLEPLNPIYEMKRDQYFKEFAQWSVEHASYTSNYSDYLKAYASKYSTKYAEKYIEKYTNISRKKFQKQLQAKAIKTLEKMIE